MLMQIGMSGPLCKDMKWFWGSGDQRSRSHKAIIRHKSPFSEISLELYDEFLPCDAMQARPVPSCSVHLSLCVSVCLSRSYILLK